MHWLVVAKKGDANTKIFMVSYQEEGKCHHWRCF